MKTKIVFRSARIFDGESETLRTNENVFVEGSVISEISDRPPDGGDEVVDCGGRVLMPGLIDAHVHVYAAGLNIVRVVQTPTSYSGTLCGSVSGGEPRSWLHYASRRGGR